VWPGVHECQRWRRTGKGRVWGQVCGLGRQALVCIPDLPQSWAHHFPHVHNGRIIVPASQGLIRKIYAKGLAQYWAQSTCLRNAGSSSYYSVIQSILFKNKKGIAQTGAGLSPKLPNGSMVGRDSHPGLAHLAGLCFSCPVKLWVMAGGPVLVLVVPGLGPYHLLPRFLLPQHTPVLDTKPTKSFPSLRGLAQGTPQGP
jgi:hypothetical protein